jgi:plasmid stability protein
VPNLSIKDVPESVAAALRQRAARNHRSLQGELMALVVRAAAEEAHAAPGWAAAAPAGSAAGSAAVKTIEQVAREHRARRPSPLRGAVRGGAQVRRDRDGR